MHVQQNLKNRKGFISLVYFKHIQNYVELDSTCVTVSALLSLIPLLKLKRFYSGHIFQAKPELFGTEPLVL